jgi:hypothetical protein
MLPALDSHHPIHRANLHSSVVSTENSIALLKIVQSPQAFIGSRVHTRTLLNDILVRHILNNAKTHFHNRVVIVVIFEKKERKPKSNFSIYIWSLFYMSNTYRIWFSLLYVIISITSFTDCILLNDVKVCLYIYIYIYILVYSVTCWLVTRQIISGFWILCSVCWINRQAEFTITYYSLNLTVITLR